jgi:hypothetical protein
VSLAACSTEPSGHAPIGAHPGVDFGNGHGHDASGWPSFNKFSIKRRGFGAAAEQIHNDVRIEKKWGNRSAIAELFREPLRLLAQLLDPSSRTIHMGLKHARAKTE